VPPGDRLPYAASGTTGVACCVLKSDASTLEAAAGLKGTAGGVETAGATTICMTVRVLGP